ncbi:MAG: DNA mismatch repair endonuclease MutL [Myxococcota bacterium]
MQRLPSALIDQIAAGEVVERPASVVKELLENALDAGAQRLRVELRDGGRAFIAVTDDGVGMSRDDALLALERHATSKLRTAEDLVRIASFGFRGEALPAIASVSKFRLKTRRQSDEVATEIRVEGGGEREPREAGGPVGTRVEVAELFWNVPARRKFLKTANTEWGHATDWIARTALALPGVHIDVIRDDRPAWSWPAVSDPLDRLAVVLGEAEAEALVPVASEEGRVRVHGWVSRPDRHRRNLSGVYWFVNGRPVRDRTLQHALVDCYRDALPRGRFPSAVLFLELPPEAVDVNVHPAKWEVRFADGRSAHRWVRQAVRDGFAGRRWLAADPGASAVVSSTPSQTTHPSEARWAGGAGPPPAASGERPGGFPSATAGAAASGATDWLFARDAGEPAAPAAEARVRFGDLRLLGQTQATYLIVEGKEELLLVDQHAAHERILYEQLRAHWLEHGVERQGLLTPLAVQLEPQAMAVLTGALEDALRLGFELEPFGEDTMAIRSVPALLADRDPAQLLRGLADAWLEGESGRSGEAADVRVLEAADRVFATLACHAARRKGDHLDPREQQALLDGLDAVPWAPTCPHGRPVVVPFSLAEIERRFGRR